MNRAEQRITKTHAPLAGHHDAGHSDALWMTRVYLITVPWNHMKRPGWGGRSNGKGCGMSKASILVKRLSAAERRSLKQIDAGPLRRHIPFRHTEKLIGLGLVELILGEPGLTIGGRRALGLIGA